jgi:HlyD family secretion protein
MRNLWQRRKWWLIGGVVGAIVLVLVGLPLLMGGPPAGAPLGPGQGSVQATADGSGTGERVEAFIGDLSSEAAASGTLEAGQTAALSVETGGTIAEVLVEVGDAVSAGDPLVRMDTGALERDVASARQALAAQEANLSDLLAPATVADLAAAEASVASAQAQLDDLLDGPSAEEIAAAEANLRAAQADISAAQARLGSVAGDPDGDAVRAAQLKLDLARQAATTAAEQHATILVTEPNQFISAEDLADMELAARAQAQQANADLAAAQSELDEVLNGDAGSVAGAQAAVSAAVAQRDAAQAQLDLLMEGATDAEIASARSTLAQAQLQLEQLRDGPSEAQRAGAEVAVEQARISLQRAEQALADATLVSPFDGLVTAVYARVGEMASGTLVELVDPSRLEVVLEVDEADIPDVQPGQPAEVTFESWPDEVIAAEVVAIAPRATAGDLSTYRVYLALQGTELPVRAGMTADARLTSGTVESAVLLPNAAINADRQSGTYTVNRVTTGPDGEEVVVVTPVTIGLRDRRNTQITSGLNAGDTVVIDGAIPSVEFGIDTPAQPGGPLGNTGD